MKYRNRHDVFLCNFFTKVRAFWAGSNTTERRKFGNSSWKLLEGTARDHLFQVVREGYTPLILHKTANNSRDYRAHQRT